MKSVVSSRPVCGRCCEVAPFPWVGEPHRCVRDDAEPVEYGNGGAGAIAERSRTFDDCLHRAIRYGERSGGGCTGIDDETFAAINAVATEFPHATIASIAAAHEEFARDLRGVHYFESCAVLVACRDGVIPRQMQSAPTQSLETSAPADDELPAAGEKIRPPREYDADSITIIVPEPVAARAWILANRVAPSDLYREHVINGDWHCGRCY